MDRGRILDMGAVLSAVVLAAILSLLFIGRKSLWVDEAGSIFTVREWSHMWRQLLGYDANMWLYSILLHFWLRLGDSEAVVRGLSAILAVCTIPVIYALGRSAFGRRSGAIAAMLMAVNPFFIEYAHEARGYTLLLLLVTLSSYLFIQAVDRQSRRWWIAHGLCTGLSVYAHFFAVLVYFAQLISLAFRGRKGVPWRDVALSAALVGILLLPLILFAPFGSVPRSWIPHPTVFSILRLFRVAAGSRPLLPMYFLFCVVALLSVFFGPHRETSGRATWRYLLAAMWAVLPVLLTFAFSVVVAPVFVDRYLIIIVPGMVLLAAAGISRLPRTGMQAAVVGLVLCLSAQPIHGWHRYHDKGDWRRITGLITGEARPGDAVAFYWYTGKRAFDYYRARAAGAEAYPAAVELGPYGRLGRGASRQLATQLLDSLPGAYERVWLVLWADEAIAGQDRAVILRALQTHYALVSERAFPHIRVLLFEKLRTRTASLFHPSSLGYSSPP